MFFFFLTSLVNNITTSSKLQQLLDLLRKLVYIYFIIKKKKKMLRNNIFNLVRRNNLTAPAVKSKSFTFSPKAKSAVAFSSTKGAAEQVSEHEKDKNETPSGAGATHQQNQKKASSEKIKNVGLSGAAIPDGVDFNQLAYETYTPMQEFESSVRIQMQSKLGEGTYDLYRAIYKDLCDEMRREVFARAPAPVAGWTAHHEPYTRFMTFKRTKRPEEDFEVIVHAEVAIQDPKTINEVMQFLNWYPFEVFIRRGEYTSQMSCCFVESNPQIRNFKIYHDEKDELRASLKDEVISHKRTHLRYDGPFQGHLELDLQTEMFDFMLDVGIDCYFLRYASEWVAFCEHQEYTRWAMNVLDAAAPQVRFPKEGDYEYNEEDFVAREERMGLDQQAEEWMPERAM